MIETTRLRLLPLTYAQLQRYLRTDYALERELGLEQAPRSIPPELREALEQTLLPNVADPEQNYLFCTLWTIISKDENRMVADLCLTGPPNADGEIEVGYGTYEAFQGRGYMTEAVGGLIEWARAQPGVSAIVATTRKDNAASFAVLRKNRFVPVGEDAEELRWKLVL